MEYFRRLPEFDYLSPRTVEEVLSLIKTHKGKAKLYGGGTIVLHRMKGRVYNIPYLIGLKAIDGLDKITIDGTSHIRIGAMVKHGDIAQSMDVKRVCPLFAETCSMLGTPQIRNMGTIGGNVASMFATAETMPVLVALGAEAKLVSQEGERIIPIEDIHRNLKGKEIITEIVIPLPPSDAKTGYKKFALRERFDYATVSAAVLIQMDGDRCGEIRIGLGGVTLPTRRPYEAEEALKGNPLNDEVIERVSTLAAENSRTGSDIMFSADYKKKLLKVMVKRAILQAVKGVA
ncbi:MAG: xanthine dehydrogenase family protein subunit M [Syntrophorhabdaceae bacterium]|nr:xanthine dehydrogenase family protein subunit M [Syntrophorhabdaceae bacterium]